MNMITEILIYNFTDILFFILGFSVFYAIARILKNPDKSSDFLLGVNDFRNFSNPPKIEREGFIFPQPLRSPTKCGIYKDNFYDVYDENSPFLTEGYKGRF